MVPEKVDHTNFMNITRYSNDIDLGTFRYTLSLVQVQFRGVNRQRNSPCVGTYAPK